MSKIVCVLLLKPRFKGASKVLVCSMRVLIIFGVLRAITLGRGFADSLGNLGPTYMPQLMELGAHPRFTLGGDQRGASGAGRAVTAHDSFLW